jgi:hypothetical protein
MPAVSFRLGLFGKLKIQEILKILPLLLLEKQPIVSEDS